jgi:hypothetical protein
LAPNAFGDDAKTNRQGRKTLLAELTTFLFAYSINTTSESIRESEHEAARQIDDFKRLLRFSDKKKEKEKSVTTAWSLR